MNNEETKNIPLTEGHSTPKGDKHHNGNKNDKNKAN